MLHQGKSILVVGSTGPSIGSCAAERIAQDGGRVVRHSEKPRSEVQGLDEGLYVQANLFDPLAAVAMVEEAWELTGGLDSLVYNAGTCREPHFLEATSDDIMRTFNLNLF